MAAVRPRPQVVRLTDAAAERIKAVMAKAESRIAAVRVGVKNGGCAGMAYTMEYADKINPLDEVVEDKGVRILIDPKAVLFLLAQAFRASRSEAAPYGSDKRKIDTESKI
jgi:iron-sulfur cluster assembly protein